MYEIFIAPYIYPIMVGNDCVGQGFVADGFFITAAHVVKDNPNCYIKIGDHKLMSCNYKYQYGRKVIDAYYIDMNPRPKSLLNIVFIDFCYKCKYNTFFRNNKILDKGKKVSFYSNWNQQERFVDFSHNKLRRIPFSIQRISDFYAKSIYERDEMTSKTQ